jgi:hypothetical protein
MTDATGIPGGALAVATNPPPQIRKATPLPQITSDAAQKTEFDRQVATLVGKGYPSLAGLTEDEFVRRLAPLEEGLAQWPHGQGRLSFVVVVTSELIPPAQAIPLLALKNKRGFTDVEPDDLARFRPIESVSVPKGPAYLLVDVDAGGDYLNVTPDDALPKIVGDGRSPLTVEEGIAVVTQFPEVLANSRFSLLGSRCGDRRVPAIWVSQGRPRLGWCWAAAPHTWLGSASCAQRIGV